MYKDLSIIVVCGDTERELTEKIKCKVISKTKSLPPVSNLLDTTDDEDDEYDEYDDEDEDDVKTLDVKTLDVKTLDVKTLDIRDYDDEYDEDDEYHNTYIIDKGLLYGIVAIKYNYLLFTIIDINDKYIKVYVYYLVHILNKYLNNIDDTLPFK